MLVSAPSGPAKRSLLKQDPDALSASVDIEDIIEDYDRSSMRSKTISLATLSNNRRNSTTYFSLNDDTTSFHSALQDGFPINQYQMQETQFDQLASNLLWANDNSNQRDSATPSSHFQVFWSDLVYKIEPKLTIGSLWHDFNQAIRLGSSSVFGLANCGRDNAFTGGSDPSTIRKQREPSTIINGISGSFKSGELTAVMGPSGAGKTSLLNFLSRRREEGYTGQLYIDNSHRRTKISTIPQHDHLPEYLTVMENLMFASRLKNPHSNYDHLRNIEKVSKLLGLDDCLRTRTKKISGGQHKRLSIAQELLSKPDILILDEPTSGLDSLTCYKTISFLKNLVISSFKRLIDPIAIIVTIHQPQEEVFGLFDKVYVMATGGVVIYDGSPERCTRFIEEHANIRMLDKDHNPASFLIELASGEYGVEPIKALENQVKREFIANSRQYKSRSLSKKSSKNSDVVKEGSYKNNTSRTTSPGVKLGEANAKLSGKPLLYIDQRIAKGSSMNKGNFWLKTRILAERYWISITRDPKQLIARIIFHIFLPMSLAFMIGSKPGQANACPKYVARYELKDLVSDGSDFGSGVQEEMLLTLENIALLFVLIYALSSANLAATTLSFTLDMQSSLKEFHNGWYSMPAYITARFLTDTPIEILLPILSLAIGYPLTGQMTSHGMWDGYRVLITSLAMILGSMVGQTLGMIFGAIYVGHVSTALFASQGATLPLVFLSGFVVRTKYMSKFVYALSQLSFYRHVLDVTVITRYGFKVCPCEPNTITGQDPKLEGVPDRLRAFTTFWMSSFSEEQQDTVGNFTVSNPTTMKLPAESNSEKNSDIFQIFAKQISLYDSYGIDVKSCDDVIPFQLHDLTLSESDLPSAFLALIILLISIRLLLFLTVKLVLHLRTSL